MATAKRIGQSGEVELDSKVFGVEPHKFAVHAYVKGFLRNQRQGTHSTKTRAEVRGGGIKPWRQKGTGRARSGSNSSPVWVGGGRAFGPKPRDYYGSIPRQVKRSAIQSALSQKAAEQKILIIDDLQMERPRTKTVVELLSGAELYGKKVLILNETKNLNFERSCRNIPGVEYRQARLANAYALLNAEYLLMTESALKVVQEVFAQ